MYRKERVVIMKKFEVSVVYHFDEGGFSRKIYNIAATNINAAKDMAKDKIYNEFKKNGKISIAYAFEK